MTGDARKLARLRRLETIRALAKQQAVRDAADAEGALARLSSLAARTRAMAQAQTTRLPPQDGADLGRHILFDSGLAGIARLTDRDAAAAQTVADDRQAALALAERRRAAVEDRLRQGQRAAARREPAGPTAPRRALGTGLE